jgi:hypothetical protein
MVSCLTASHGSMGLDALPFKLSARGLSLIRNHGAPTTTRCSFFAFAAASPRADSTLSLIARLEAQGPLALRLDAGEKFRGTLRPVELRPTRLKIGAMLPGCKTSPICSRPIKRRKIGPSLILPCSSQTFSHRTVSRERYAALPCPSASVVPRRTSAWPLTPPTPGQAAPLLPIALVL